MKPVKFLLVCSFMTIGFLSYSQKNKVSTSTEVSNNTPFDFLNGNWIVYNNESALAAYNKFEPIADGKGIVEQYQNRKGVTSMGIFYQDPVTHHWMHTWVSDNARSVNPIGTRTYEVLQTPGNKKYYFYGESTTNGKIVKDRVVFNYISKDSLQKIYEVSTDNGLSWDCELKETFKRVN